MTRFYLIRHGEKASPDKVLATRAPGVPLTSRGREQAEAIARFLADRPLHHIASSPMERAQQTAEPLARLKGIRVEVDPAFHEFDFGEWTMKSIDSLHGGDVWTNFNSFRSATPAPGGESMLDVQARVVRGLILLRDRFPDQAVAVFSHGDPIRAAVCYFAGAAIDFGHRFEISVGSVSTIDLSPNHVQLQEVNRIPLPR
jgi:broad specificity phosphatase PhoE